MGNLNTKNLCIDADNTEVIPKFHFKCRYSKDDNYCLAQAYTRTQDIMRYPVPRNKIKWNIEYLEYNPIEFTSEKILKKDGQNYKDPHINDANYKIIKFNSIDLNSNCDRTSFHGPYEFIKYKPGSNVLVPCNPVGRTGLIGRGHLGRWGPNHAADPIVTTWKRDEKGNKVFDAKTDRPILQFVSIQRKDTKEWALPGGMRDPGEKISRTLIREFTEEALNKQVEFNKFGRIVGNSLNVEKQLNIFFKGGTQIYKGYVDDPRNTDNSWMETIACNFHDEEGNIVSCFKLEGGDDAENAKWIDLSGKLKLFASHADFLREVANLRDAHW